MSHQGHTTAPYVVSADLQVLFDEWARTSGFTPPSNQFFEDLRGRFVAHMSGIFTHFELLPEAVLIEETKRLCQSVNGTPIISLDRVYSQGTHWFDVTRAITSDGDDHGLAARHGSPSMEDQLANLAQSIQGECVLVDDVIFSGKVAVDVASALSKHGINVSTILATVGIAEGVSHIESAGMMVDCVYHYPEVIDQVCERDFYPGVPLSGRLHHGVEGASSPYVLPFGLPGRWASIPESAEADFSRFCLEQTIALFTEVERVSNRIVRCRDVPRKVAGIESDDSRFVDALTQAQASIP